jgi:hypothetical protein
MMVEVEEPREAGWWRASGTVPRNIERALIPLLYEHRDKAVNLSELVREVPVRVRFTAVVERSPDNGVALFKQPRNAVLL